MGFYTEACEMDAKNTPFRVEMEKTSIDDGDVQSKIPGLNFFKAKNGNLHLSGPVSIMNENVAINYRTIYNSYAMYKDTTNDGNSVFTEYNDYLRCINATSQYQQYLTDKKNPTYNNILKYYGNSVIDKYGLSKYKIEDFIYLKYFNQIPNNYMITLRRYTRPCEDHMFGLDMPSSVVTAMNGYQQDYFAIATAVTYMGEQTGNKLSDILKYTYGMNWEKKTAQVTSLKNSDGGLAAQLKNRPGVGADYLSGDKGLTGGAGSAIASAFAMSAMIQGKGVNVQDAMGSQHAFEGNEFDARYGNNFYGDLNVVQETMARARGITFSNEFSLTFEYSLKSLQCVNPRIAMMDILSNFYILTGNYGQFWGGSTMFYGQRSIAPQYGDPSLLRQGKYGEYMNSLWSDMKQGFTRLKGGDGSNGKDGNALDKILNVAKNLLNGGMQSLLGNLFGGNIGVAGESQVPPALLSGAPTGYWHVTIGNPLDPIVMMGNMGVTKTTVQFSDVLGYDDFPTEVKFVVELEHCRPRDNAGMENMFNGTKGRFYTFTNKGIENAYHHVNNIAWAKNGGNSTQETDGSSHAPHSKNVAKIFGGILNS